MAESGRGWGAVAVLALAAATLSIASPLLLIFVPLALLLLALPPRRPGRVVLGATLGAAAVWGVPPEPLGYVELGWVLLLGGWFVALASFWPDGRFLSRALGAVAGAAGTAAVLLVVGGRGWAYLDWTVSRHFRGAAATVASLWGAAAESDAFGARLVDGVYRAAEVQAMLHPALLSLASLAGLGVAWWAHRRMSGQEARPLAPFREFRFRDELVWLLIAGILLIVLPVGEWAPRAGSNVVAFMGVLYVLRGAAVFLVLTGMPGGGAVVVGFLALMILPMVMPAAAVVGLADTWIDLRARRAAVRPGS